MKQVLESFCTSCEWHGDGTGLAGCPVCGEPITTLDVSAENNLNDEAEEEYPEGMVKEVEDEDALSY